MSEIASEIVSILRRLVRHPLKLPKDLMRAAFTTVRYYFTGQRGMITKFEARYFGDGFATTHHVAFLHDKKFLKAYNECFYLVSPKDARWALNQDIRWRAHIVTWAAQQAIRLDGDFVECGVWWGFLSKTICEYVDFAQYKDKTFYLVDTWGDPGKQELNHVGYREDVLDIVRERFKPYPNVRLVRGFVPDVLSEVPVKKIAYLSIDMNGDVAERKTLEKYYGNIVPGGIIYFDDYGWGFPKLRETVDDFFKDKPETLLHFPSGNSIVVKLP